MNLIRKRRIVTLATILIVITMSVGLILYALKQNINLFLTPSEVTMNIVNQAQTIRLGGMVKEGSVVSKPNQTIKFIITDFSKDITVYYHGILPDLFREGKGIVAQGHLNKNGEFKADQVLAKHDENYMPPQIKRKLAKQMKTRAHS